jgi:hypothetical protein
MSKRRIRFTILAENASAEAELLTGQAPETAEAVWGILPVAGRAHHAVYSGSEGVLILPETLRVAPEAATAEVTTNDVGFTWFDAGSSHGVTEAFAEVCWFYDRDARPSMHEGPAPVSIFARFVGDTAAFYAACRRMRREGTKAMVIERVEEGRPAVTHTVAYQDSFGNAVRPHLSVAPDGRIVARFERLTYRPGKEAPSWASETGLALEIQSEDGGVSWSSAESCRPDGETQSRDGLLTLTDGRRLRFDVVEIGRKVAALQVAINGDTPVPLRYLPISDTDATVGPPAAMEIAPGHILFVYVVDEGAPDGATPGGVCALHATHFTV